MGVKVYTLVYEGEAVGYRLISAEDGIGLDFEREVFPKVCKSIKVNPSYIKQVYAGNIQMYYNKSTGLLEAKNLGDESRYLECPGEFMDFTIKKAKGNEDVNLKALIAYQWNLTSPLSLDTKVYVGEKSGLVVMSKGTCAFGMLNDYLINSYRTSYKGNGSSSIVVMGEVPSKYANIPVVGTENTIPLKFV